MKKQHLCLGEDSLHAIYRLLSDHLQSFLGAMAVALSRSLQFTSSVYTARALALPRDVRLLECKAFLSPFTRRLPHMIVMTDSFYGNRKGWFDDAMMLADDEGEDEFGVWFALLLCPLHFSRVDDWRLRHQHSRNLVLSVAMIWTLNFASFNILNFMKSRKWLSTKLIKAWTLFGWDGNGPKKR